MFDTGQLLDTGSASFCGINKTIIILLLFFFFFTLLTLVRLQKKKL